MINFLIPHSSKTIKAMIAMPVSAIEPQMFRERASLAKNVAWVTSMPRGLRAMTAASTIDIQGHCVRTFNVATSSALPSHHHHDRIFDQPLELTDQFGAERAVDRAMVARQRDTHDVRDLDLAVANDGTLLAGADRENGGVRR